MVAPMVAAAGLSALGSVIGGLTGGKGAAKAAKLQADSTAKQIGYLTDNRDFQYGLNRPTIDRGNAAGDLYGNFVGLSGGDAAAKALETFRGSTGYQDLLRQGLGAVNSNAYAGGTAQSGATLKALQDRGSQIANSSAQQWLGNLGQLQQLGQGAAGLVAGVGQNTVTGMNNATQTATDASGNAAIIGNNAWQKALQGVFNSGAQAFGSSYGGGASGGLNPLQGYSFNGSMNRGGW